MTNNSVVYRANGIAQVVYQPNAEIELYLPAVEQQSPGLAVGQTILVIPASRPAFETLKDAWHWHLETYKEAVQRQHAQVDQSSQAVLEAFNQVVGGDIRPIKKLRLQA